MWLPPPPTIHHPKHPDSMELNQKTFYKMNKFEQLQICYEMFS